MVRFLVQIVCVMFLVPMVLAVFYNWVNPASTLMFARWLTGAPVERSWTPISDISPILVRTVIASEDSRFCVHQGVDFREMQRVVEKADDLEDLRGASTITMQVVKNLFLWPKPEILRKVFELPLAIWLDLVMSKRRVMEIYLNVAQWGPSGQFGIAAGAREAFRIPPARIDAREAALLAVVLPNPIRRRAGAPTYGVEQLARRLEARVPKEGPQIVSCIYGAGARGRIIP